MIYKEQFKLLVLNKKFIRTTSEKSTKKLR